MNAIASFRMCTLSNDELLKKVDELTDNIYKEGKIPSRHIPARPNEDYDLLIGELIQRFDNKNNGWIDAKIIQPELIKGENYSENVWAICNGQRMVMCYCFIEGDDGGYAWANCNGQIDGDAEFDDEYNVTHWQHFPSIENLK